MAKGVGLISTFRGKMGNTVMYRIKDSATKETQGLRVYQPQVSNPQTDYQLDQRIKMAAVNNCYRALKPLIDRGFEGVDYGNLSRREFMKLALTNPYSGPFVVKGSTTPYPVLSPISKGTLPDAGARFASSGALVLSVPYNSGYDLDYVAGVSSLFLQYGYQVGDQVTVILLTRINANSPMVYHWGSFYINPDSTEAILDALGNGIEAIVSDGNIGFHIDGDENLALAVIVSREGSHLRSTARFAIAGDVQGFSELYTGAAAAPARASYRRAAARTSSDWEEDPGTEGESVGTFTLQGYTVTDTRVSGDAVVLTTTDSAVLSIHIANEANRAYQKYIVGKQFVAASYAETQPLAASDSIQLGTGANGALTEIENQFVNWLIDKLGYDYRTLTTMPQ